MICERCGRHAPTKQVEFHQNIALLVVRYPSSIAGELCKRCIHGCFWRMTLTSLVAGWWGLISFFVNVFFICHNVAEYLACLSLPDRDSVASPTAWTAERLDFTQERLERWRGQIDGALAAGEDIQLLSDRISDLANVPARDARAFIERVRLARAN